MIFPLATAAMVVKRKLQHERRQVMKRFSRLSEVPSTVDHIVVVPCPNLDGGQEIFVCATSKDAALLAKTFNGASKPVTVLCRRVDGTWKM